MKYVADATAVVFLLLGICLLAVLVKTFFLDPRKKRPDA